jgi:hypothetical protein
MANPEHLKILKQGVAGWNAWRKDNPLVAPDLSGADVSWCDLSKSNLSHALLGSAYLNFTNLHAVNFREARLARAHLSSATLLWADLQHADLREAVLSGANLTGAKLCNANMQRSVLNGANFYAADLRESNLSGAQLLSTVFGMNDLSCVRGLETVDHVGPSTIGIDTIYKSNGNIPEAFLRGAGVPEDFITYMKSLVGKAIDFYSCFISYSSKDDDFAQRLHADLQQRGVRCWFAPEDLKIGDKFRMRIDESIRIYEKLMVLLSVNSIRSSWVEEEVEAALEKERKQNKLVLFPIRLDDAVMETDQAWAASLRRTRHIGDFRAWKDHDQYHNSFERLLRDLKAEST